MLAPQVLPVNWGIVGCGWVARDYVAPAIAASDNGRLVALCDVSELALASVQPTDSTLHRTTSLADFMQTPGLQAVYVATPNAHHAYLVQELVAAGLPVLCEKPLARTAPEAAGMVAAAEAAGTLLATAFDQRFHPAHVRLRELIQAGALGRITCVRIHYACWTPANWAPDTDQGTYQNWRISAEEAGGGAMIDLAPHGLDLVQTLLDEPLTAVAALTQQRIHDYPVDDGAVLIGSTASGVLFSQAVAYNCPDQFPRRTLEVIGDQGRVVAVNTMGQTPGGTLTLTHLDGTVEDVSFDTQASPFQRQIEAFAAAVQSGQSFPFPPARDLHTMRLLDVAAACSQELRAGQPVLR
ncbi:Gfo/Idh/MocA family oxidoreductase [Hymenobacter sp. YC55]|uniref:Gfo/Idh/MocA family protein n=1 Tax=Hymenobacter sp. YC55 TaxID=3034019 RepID=UPI0023F75961|nr:Gfo/Idh/MocA family oxidoreductase [Hymenobacter sp. YC55]MDF7814085.1 Gfo/Idh/MocA family oxidoreductase [Hymenobacter sp. YC55]